MENLHGLEAHKEAFANLGERLAELDRESNGQAFKDDQGAEFEAILEQRAKLDKAIAELEVREKAVAEAMANPRTTEAGSGFAVPNFRKVPDDIYDLASYRTSSVDQLADAYRDGAM